MTTYTCAKCSHSYNPDDGDNKQGISPGTAWSELPTDWVCPDCGAPKFEFSNFAGGSGEGTGWAAS